MFAGWMAGSCRAWQIAVRTGLRLFEVNPLLLGALPAGVAILASSRRQRLGDWLAGTVVAPCESAEPAAAPRVRIVTNRDRR